MYNHNIFHLKRHMMIVLKKLFCILTFVPLTLCTNLASAIEPSHVINLPSDTKFYINKEGGISHNTYIIEIEDKKLFFKATKEKLALFETAKRAITEYFKNDYPKEQQSMLLSLQNEENLNKFIYMKTYGDGQAAKWLKDEDKSDTSVLGFTEPLSETFKTEVLPQFLHYAFSEFVQYRANRRREIGELQINQLLGSLATIRIANLLNIPYLVVKTEYVQIKTSAGEHMLGIVMESAKGISFKEVKQLENHVIQPSLQLDFSTLWVLDALCAQRDRSPGNYFIVINNGNHLIGVSAYDNDLAFDTYNNLQLKNYVLPPILREDNTFVLPHMDKTLAHKILALEPDDVQICLQDLLNEVQIEATINRLRQLQNAIKNSMKANPDFLLEPSEWNNQTIEDELSINGDTYFKHFVDKLNSDSKK